VIAALGNPHHRALDAIVREGAPTWVIAWFAYGAEHAGLRGEDVDIYILDHCTQWRRIGSAVTTREHEHAEIGGVPDIGGRVYFEIPASERLAVGMHRVLVVACGDRSSAEATIDVVGANTPVVVSDVDGTLTQSENAEIWSDLHVAEDPTAHPGAPDVLRALASRGYHIVYLTARPEWLTMRTHRWLDTHGFPPGVVRTSFSELGCVGASAQAFKTRSLAALAADLGHAPSCGFGNRPTDVAAYRTAGIEAGHCYYYQLAGDLAGGHRVDDYRTLVATFEAFPPACR
jgi:phosphoglycolate phosphatase-like HAD superfamily hydrolase